MATSQDILEESELAKGVVNGSDFPDDYKRVFLKLINTATAATNGISPEEKIQMMTESICMLAQTQVLFVKNLDEKIQRAIDVSNANQCDKCIAMKHAQDIQNQKERDELIEQLKKEGVIKTDPVDENDDTPNWTTILKTILMKPWLYIIIGILAFSPYGVQMLDRILQCFSK